MEQSVERRKNRRYKANEGSYAAMGANEKTLGQIIDISLGGICFKYIGSLDDDEKSETEQAGSILLSYRGCFIKRLSGKIVDDYPFVNQPSFSSMNLRKRHFQFIDLNIGQTIELEHSLKSSGPEMLAGPFPEQTNQMIPLK